MKLVLGSIILTLGLSACGTASRWVANTAEIEDRSVPGARLDWQRAARPELHERLPSQRIAYAGEIPSGEQRECDGTISASIAQGPAHMELFTRKVVKRTLHFHLIDKADNATNILSVDVNRNAGTRERAIPTDTTAHQGTVNTLCVLSLILVLVGLVSISIGGGYLVLLGMLMGIAGMIQAGVRGQRGEGFALVAVLLPIALLLLLLIILKDQHWS